jgi:xylulokinase
MAVCVLNLGLKSIRAAVFDESGKRLAIAHRPIATLMGEGRVEQSPDEWWAAGVETLDQVLVGHRLGRAVDVLTVTASAGCVVPIARDGSALGHAIMISDVRAADQAERIGSSLQDVGSARRRVSLDLGLPKILWIRENEPKRYESCAWFLSPSDFLLFRLTGDVLTDTNTASKLLYDRTQETYASELMDALGMDVATLPPVVRPGTTAMPLLPAIRERFGLREDVRAVVSTYDAICAVYGSGVATVGDACDVSGTVTSFRVVTDSPPKENAGLFVSPHLTPGLHLAGGSNNLGGGVIEWAKQLLYPTTDDPYECMLDEANDTPPGASGITFLPYLLGERAPIWNPNARAVFFGLARHHQRGDLIRAIFEGVGYSVLDIANRLRDLGIRIERVSVSGGLARLPLINQIKSDMVGVVVQATEEIETTALGAGLIALCCTDRYGSMTEAIDACVRVGQAYEPDAARTAMYRDFFEVYRSLYSSLQDLFLRREHLISLHGEVLRTKPTYTENL